MRKRRNREERRGSSDGWETRGGKGGQEVKRGREWTVDLEARGSLGMLGEEEGASSLLETLLRTPELSREDVLTFILDMIATGIDTVQREHLLWEGLSEG